MITQDFGSLLSDDQIDEVSGGKLTKEQIKIGIGIAIGTIVAVTATALVVFVVKKNGTTYTSTPLSNADIHADVDKLRSQNSGVFVGVEKLKSIHARQIAYFEEWAGTGNWRAFHTNHYDWWAYSIDQRSRGQGELFNLPQAVIGQLKSDQEFVSRHRRGMELGMLAWGWDIQNKKSVDNPALDQRWQNWPIRLHKMAKSAQLFGYTDYYASMCAFVGDLKLKGIDAKVYIPSSTDTHS